METIFDDKCLSRSIFEDLSKKWVILAIILLAEKPLRFGELQKQAAGVSQKMLTQALRILERDGLVNREVNTTTIPITVMYSLTTLGESLIPSLQMLKLWIERHRDEINMIRESAQ